MGCALALSGRLDEGLSPLEGADQEARRRGRGTGVFQWVQEIRAHMYLVGGRESEAVVVARECLEACRRAARHGAEARLLQLLGDIAASGGAPTVETAERRYHEALALAGELGMRPLIAHCHLGLGKLYRRTGKTQQALEYLTSAMTMYRSMDMEFWLEKAEAELNARQPS